jgi:hypothetical protein
MYNIYGGTIIDRCNSSIIPYIRDDEEKNPTVSRENTMLCHQILGHIGDKGF